MAVLAISAKRVRISHDPLRLLRWERDLGTMDGKVVSGAMGALEAGSPKVLPILVDQQVCKLFLLAGA